MSTLFDFSDPNSMLRKATKASTNRRSGTVEGTVRHAMIHTSGVPATIHHTVVAAMPHPIRQRANEGDHYMVAYVSVPITWLAALTQTLALEYEVSFVGPAGYIQKLPPTLLELETMIRDRVYIGFDWLKLPTNEQLGYPAIQSRLIQFVNTLRKSAEGETDE